MPRFYLDCETLPIEPGIACPDLVCAQYAIDDAPPRILNATVARDRAELRDVLVTNLKDPDVVFIAHNGSFDWAAICKAFPDLVPLVFRMFLAGRARDTLVREVLKCIKDGTLRFVTKRKGFFRLASLAERYLHKEVLKGDDSWQLRYGELEGIEVADWPEDAVSYCEQDITTLQELEATEELNPDPSVAGYDFPDEWLQAFAAFCLHLMAVWGARVDGERHAAAEAHLEEEQVKLTAVLEASGLMVDGTVKYEAAAAIITAACKKAGVDPPRTKSGKKIKTDEATIEEFADGHEALRARVDFNANRKVLGTYLLPMRAGIERCMNSRPNVLVASGRTSWGGALVDGEREGTNLQNFPTKGKIRDCFRPRPGHLWLGVDYSSLELRTLAQCLLWIGDRSVLADGYRADVKYDPHKQFALSLMRLDPKFAKATDAELLANKEFKQFRQRAKVCNFGYPGGLGAARFVEYAKGYGLEVTEAEAHNLKRRWFAQFPEMRGYFDYVDYLVNAGGDFRQFVSNRVRGGTGFCDGANTFFQGLAADGAKLALCLVSTECYAVPSSPLFGSRILAFVHDELDLEVPADRASEAADRVVHLMESAMNRVTPDIPHQAVPALSTAWIKEAEERREGGRLVVWG